MALERFEPWADDWGAISADHLSRYLYATKFVQGKRVLDAGTGYGYGAAILAAYGAETVTAVDISTEVIAKAKQVYNMANLQFVADNCETLSTVEGRFDLICNFENIEHLNAPSDFVKRSSQLLNADGVMLCSTPDRNITPPFVNGKPANPFHVNEWFPNDFIELLSNSYNKVVLYAQIRRWSLRQRENGVSKLNLYFAVNPMLRLGNWVKRLFGRGVYNADIYSLVAPSEDDYPVHPYEIATLLGERFCLFAICSMPKH